jgi:hypothetical protein
MASRFAALQDEPDDQEDDSLPSEPIPSDPLDRLSPRYSIDDILQVQRQCGAQPPPPELQRFEGVCMRDAQAPEFATTRPPASDINSPAAYGGKDKAARPYQQGGQRRPVSPRAAPPRPKKAPAAAPPNAPAEDCEPAGAAWFYRDPLDQVMGPYSARRMREWCAKGYFDRRLQIAAADSGPFQPVGALFPDHGLAFAGDAPPPGRLAYGDPPDERGRRLETLVSFSAADADDLGGSWESVDLAH